MIRRGLIEKIKDKDKSVYRLSMKSEEYLSDIEKYFLEFLLITNQFFESIFNRIPKSYAQGIFKDISRTGNLDIIPEHTFLKELNRLTNNKQIKEILLIRKKTLLHKLSIIEEKLRDLP